MKRSVAILGPTPQFVRWAIVQKCPLKEPDGPDLPAEAFRQLRGLREYSIGLIEDRVLDGICVQQNASRESIEHVRGFHGHEVLDAHGDADFVDDCCRNCPANALNQQRPGVWAGCYGWLPAISGHRWQPSQSLAATEPGVTHPHLSDLSKSISYVDLLDELVNESHVPIGDSEFRKTTPRWYGFWMNPILQPHQLESFLPIFDAAVKRCQRLGLEPETLVGLVQFRDGIQQCVAHQMSLAVDLVPPGNSDGQTWTIAAHCPDCKHELKNPGRQMCPSCGRFGSPHGQRKSKVLGLRPYIKLAGVLGKTPASEFMNRYLSR